MSAESLYPDDWNSSYPLNSQLNAWKLEDDLKRIDSKVDDCLSGFQYSDGGTSYDWKLDSYNDADRPLRRFQTPPPRRTAPTPLEDLFSQTIDIAEVNSESWRSSLEPEEATPPAPLDSREAEAHSEALDAVEFKPQDMFAFSEKDNGDSDKSAPDKAAADKTEPDKAAAKSDSPSAPLNVSARSAQANESGAMDSTAQLAPTLIVEAKSSQPFPVLKRPLLTLSVGISICGVGMVFGSQIMRNALLINPGKALIIAGVVGLTASCFMYVARGLFRPKTA